MSKWFILFFGATIFLTPWAGAQQSPFGGTPRPIPGVVEAEDYDNGGEGVAYHDVDTGNSGGAYRLNEGVDIEAASEHGFNIGWIENGEWVEYTVLVQKSGLYDIEVRAAATANSFYAIFLDEHNLTGQVGITTTAGWQDYKTFSAANIYLPAGEQVLKFAALSAGFNLNYINFKLKTETNAPVVKITSPADKAEFYQGDVITITATASDADGSITKVEFYADEVRLGEDRTAPYSITWNAANIGPVNFYAVAFDNAGAFTKSKKVDVDIKFPNYYAGPDFSVQRGFYKDAFDLTISTALTDAQIKYTIDGSDPVTSKTAKTANAPATLRIDPISTVGRGDTPAYVVRAIAVRGGAQLTRVQTHTYVFTPRVGYQRRPTSWPATEINGQRIRYDIDRQVVNDSRYKNIFESTLVDIPTISIVTDMANLFDSQTGIYVNAVEHGEQWERPTSVELINTDGSTGFHVDAGLRIRGGWSRNDSNPKHAFRLFFREEYGYAKLEYPLFENEGANQFDKIDLRCSQNYSWAYQGSPMNTANRDVFSRDVQREMGQPYTRSRYYHLYLNGMYWGLYETQERSEATYAAEYFGGSREDYDVVKVDAGYGRPYVVEATDGNLDGWNEVWLACQQRFLNNVNYFALEGRNGDGTINPAGRKLVDIDNLIDYMITIFHTGNYDAPVSKFSNNSNPNNFYAIYNRNKNDGFLFFAHDNEHTLIINNGEGPSDGIEENRVNIGSITGRYQMWVDNFEKFHPQWLHFQLSKNAEYRQRFADHVYRHYYNNGVLTPERASALFMSRANMIDMAIIAESARWGSMWLSKHAAWEPIINEISGTYFNERWGIVLDQYIDEHLYSTIEPPRFKADNQLVKETKLTVAAGYVLKLENPNSTGTIYCTTDGSDPRAIGGAVASAAKTSSSITANSTLVVNARIKSGANWSAQHSLTLYVPEDMQVLKITEIHYKPLPEGDVSGGEYEFIEFKNTGSGPVDLSLASFTTGITYTFPVGTMLNAGQFVVLASNAQAFQQRYSFKPFGEFTGQLDNAGERIVLANTVGDTVITVRYNDKAPWPEEADSLGKSLAAVEVMPKGSPDNPVYWAASHWPHGSPGKDDKVATVVAEKKEQPGEFALYQNYPNPFNGQTTIEFYLPVKTFVRLSIYDILGREVQTLVNGFRDAGSYKINWQVGEKAAGMYFYKLAAGADFQQIRKLVHIK